MASQVQSAINEISTHLSSPSSSSIIPPPSPNDIVVTCALRTPFTKGGRGLLKDTPGSDLLVSILSSVLTTSGLPADLIEDITVGNVLAPGGGATEFRAAAFAAGFPASTSVRATNRQCSSGLQAVIDTAHAIQCGMISIGIGAGVESMSSQYGPNAVTEFSPLLESHQDAADCKVPMGVLSEDMAREKAIARIDQDAFAARSYARAATAQDNGWFDAELAPVSTTVTDPKTQTDKPIRVTADDGVRRGITPSSLAKIRAAFAADGSIHAGNASQISDGAAAVLLMRRSTAEKLSQPILGRYLAAAVVGVPPLLMGVGPWKAIPAALDKANLKIEDVALYEINEAFASQALWCVRELGIKDDRVNVKGGAIAFGHPLGATGARVVATLLHELRRRGCKGDQGVGVTSMCVGTGMGMAAVWVAE